MHCVALSRHRAISTRVAASHQPKRGCSWKDTRACISTTCGGAPRSVCTRGMAGKQMVDRDDANLDVEGAIFVLRLDAGEVRGLREAKRTLGVGCRPL